MRAAAVSPRHHLSPNLPLGADSRSHLEKTACESGENRRERCCDIAFLRGSPGCKPALKRVFAFSDAAIAITAIIHIHNARPTLIQMQKLAWVFLQPKTHFAWLLAYALFQIRGLCVICLQCQGVTRTCRLCAYRQPVPGLGAILTLLQASLRGVSRASLRSKVRAIFW